MPPVSRLEKRATPPSESCDFFKKRTVETALPWLSDPSARPARQVASKLACSELKKLQPPEGSPRLRSAFSMTEASADVAMVRYCRNRAAGQTEAQSKRERPRVWRSLSIH